MVEEQVQVDLSIASLNRYLLKLAYSEKGSEVRWAIEWPPLSGGVEIWREGNA